MKYTLEPQRPIQWNQDMEMVENLWKKKMSLKTVILFKHTDFSMLRVLPFAMEACSQTLLWIKITSVRELSQQASCERDSFLISDCST